MTLVEPSAHSTGVGRARELATVAFARDGARAGRTATVAVSGDAGIGKTWLCRSVADAAASEGFRVGWASAWAPDAPPLWPWREALRALGAGAVDDLLGSGGADGDGNDHRRFAGLIRELRHATEQAPGVVIIDDAHLADPSSLLLAVFLARHARDVKLLVMLAHRPRDESDESRARLLDELDREATLVALRGFTASEVVQVLSKHGIEEVAPDDLDFVMWATEGRPLEVQRAAASGGDPVRTLVRSRFSTLAPAVRHVAALAAVLADAPRTLEVAALCGTSTDEAATALAALEETRLGRRDATGGFVFAHPSVRDELASTIPKPELLGVHARAAEILADGDGTSADRLTERARHAIAAGDRSEADARRAVDAARRAADALAGHNRHDEAASILLAARAVHDRAGLGAPPAALVADEGSALLRSGQLTGARRVFGDAARLAEAEGDVVSSARAALGLGGVWVGEMRLPLEHERVLQLQRRALAMLPADQGTLRCRLETRLAAEVAYTSGRASIMEPVLEKARALDDEAVLAEALSLFHHTLLGPEHARTRIDIAHELMAVATRADDRLMALMGLCWYTVDLFLVGDEHAERSLRALHSEADALGCRSIGFIAEAMDAMLLLRTGQLDPAEAQANRALETGADVGDADALAYFGAQLATIRWVQGRSAEMLESLAETASSPDVPPGNEVFTAAFAAFAADAGELEQARSALTRLDQHGLDAIPSNSVWMTTMYSIVEAAALLGEREVARRASELLVPFVELPVMGSLAVVCLGSAHRPLGRASLTLGDVDAAIEHLERAVVANDRLGNRPFAALSRADLADALVTRGRADDRSAAEGLLEEAVREGTSIGLHGRVELWRRRRRALAESPAIAPRPVEAVEGSRGELRRQGGAWVVRVGDREVLVPDLVGMRYLARLLTNPGREIPAADLATWDGEPALLQPEQPLLDDRALAEYRRRVTDLESEIAEAERFADDERASRAKLELEGLLEELGRTTNVFGGARPFTSDPERARTAVRKAVRRALDHIETVDARLGADLRRSVRTGRSCCYLPGPDAPRRWVERRL